MTHRTPGVQALARRPRTRALVLGLVLTATTAAPTAAQPAAVTIEGFAFPAEVVVSAGDTVRWSNGDPAPHTVTAADGAFDSGVIDAGASFELTFDAAGTFAYACSIHPTMTGVVTVVDEAAPPADATGTTLLRRATLFDTDPLGIGGPALTLLVPDGWSIEGGPVWRHHLANLATFEGRVTSPDRRFGVEFYPFLPKVWQEGGLLGFPPGSNYLGREVREPITDPVRYLEATVLPAYRGAFSPRVIDRQPLPDVADAHLQVNLPGTKVVAERVLTEHVVEGERMLEEFTVVLAFTVIPAIPGRVTWIPQQLFSIRAPEADFFEAHPVLHAIATSPVVDLHWYAGYEAVLSVAAANGLEAIRTAGEMARIVGRANDQISDEIIAGYRRREAITDRIHEQMIQTIRGVETYRLPAELGVAELPNGYTYVYGSPGGAVILTNEPRFDPVQAFPGEVWELLDVER